METKVKKGLAIAYWPVESSTACASAKRPSDELEPSQKEAWARFSRNRERQAGGADILYSTHLTAKRRAMPRSAAARNASTSSAMRGPPYISLLRFAEHRGRRKH